MKIEAGKYYRTRCGDVVGPMKLADGPCRYPWLTIKGCWTTEGEFSLEGEHACDLISEVHVSDTPSARHRAAGPKTLRDEFAIAALTGMITADHEFTDRIAEETYEIADAMMEARKK
jgi:hypothetical protein